MIQNTKCPTCGSDIQKDQPCAACLLGLGLESDNADESKWQTPAIEEISEHFPELEFISILGRGGMGAVYKARQIALNRYIAIKILPPEISASGDFEKRFSREAQAMASLNHANIVTIYDFGERDGLYFFIMEFVDGVNCRQLLDNSRISPHEAMAIVPQICDALQCAHDHGIVHRDIKPENILMDRQGRIKVADFGLAKLVKYNSDFEFVNGSSQHNQVDTLCTINAIGTPAYMAPEQAERPNEVDHRADIYALGVVFYQMLTGELPDKKLQAPSQKVQLDIRLDEIVLKALAEKPQRRYQQASTLKTQVQNIVKNEPAKKRKKGLIKPLLALAVILAVCYFYLGESRSDYSSLENLAHRPDKLRNMKTDVVINTALNGPGLSTPWPWQELEKRINRLSSNDVTKIIQGLTQWMQQEHPNGYHQPLHWKKSFLNKLAKKKMLTEKQMFTFLDALNGPLNLFKNMTRIREGRPSFEIKGTMRNVWNTSLFGFTMVSYVNFITIDNRPIDLKTRRHLGTSPRFGLLLALPHLSPGTHLIKGEVKSALIPKDNFISIDRSALPADWPPAARKWTQSCQLEFKVYTKDAKIIELIDDPLLSPVTQLKSAIRVIIQSTNARQAAKATVKFNNSIKNAIPISFDIKLRIGKKTYSNGLYYQFNKDSGTTSGGNSEWKLPPLDPNIKYARIILTPKTSLVDSEATVNQIWGENIILENVPLIRHDIRSDENQ
ncbi:MAG: serine/threonine protein kinase [Lentisphaeraceae bacterium]|nr:serine/threonine protein kinase [Lentisphaeraceae bacterium]